MSTVPHDAAVATILLALLALSGCSALPGSSTPTGPLVESGPGEYPHEIRFENPSSVAPR